MNSLLFVGKAALLCGLVSANASADLIAIDGGSLAILSIDPNTGVGTRIGQLDGDGQNVRGLTYDMANDIVYGIYPGGTIVSIDLVTETITTIGDMGDIRTRGLAYNPNSGILYSARTGGTKRLLAYDIATGLNWVVAPLEFNADGLVYHPGLGVLLGADSSSDQLISIDLQTGIETVIGTFGPFDNISSLAYDPITERLYGTDNVTDELYRIDPLTGAATVIGDIGYGGVDNLTYIPSPGTIFVASCGLLATCRRRK